MARHFSPFQSTGHILTTSSLNRSALLMALHCLFLIISARKGGKPKVNLGLFKKALDCHSAARERLAPDDYDRQFQVGVQ